MHCGDGFLHKRSFATHTAPQVAPPSSPCLGYEARGRSGSFVLSKQACGQHLWSMNATAGPGHGFLALKSAPPGGTLALAGALLLLDTAIPFALCTEVAASLTGCMVVVPDNTNNSLGVAVAVFETESGELLKGHASAANATGDASDGMVLSVALAPGVSYSVLTALQTLRDIGCAGTTADTAHCTQSPEAAAVALLQTSAANLSAIVAESHAFWSAFWNESSIDISQGYLLNNTGDTKRPDISAAANLSVVEQFYYCAQYLLASTTRDGKVSPSLEGLAVVEPVAVRSPSVSVYLCLCLCPSPHLVPSRDSTDSPASTPCVACLA